MKRSGVFATGMSMRPPPSRSVDASWPPALAGTAVETSADLTSSTVHEGWLWRRSAAAPATSGVAMLVPSHASHWSGGTEETTLTPGAVTSGLGRREIGDGPADENEAMTLGFVSHAPPVDAATVIAEGVFAGDPIEPSPAAS